MARRIRRSEADNQLSFDDLFSVVSNSDPDDESPPVSSTAQSPDVVLSATSRRQRRRPRAARREMTDYGAMAHQYWARWLPARYRAIPNPTQFFQELGEEVAKEIDSLMALVECPQRR